MGEKDHCLTVYISSESGGVIEEQVVTKKYCGSDGELLYATLTVKEAINNALKDCMTRLRSNYKDET